MIGYLFCIAASIVVGFAFGFSLDGVLRSYWKRQARINQLDILLFSNGSLARLAATLELQADGGADPTAFLKYAIKKEQKHLEKSA